MFKPRLFAPGPTPLPEAVRAALARPILHHRTAAFAACVAAVRAGLQWIFQTEQEVLCLAATGTAAMDGAVCNLLSPGDCAIYVDAGKFGARWGEILRAYGIDAMAVQVPWGQSVAPAAVAAALQQYPQARAVYVQACETSTGCAQPVEEIAALCAQTPHTLCVVDGITAVGVWDVGMDRNQIDVLLSGAQKAFMLPPGLAFVALSDRAWEQQARARLPRYYLDFARERRAARQNQTAWTSPVSHMVALQAALELLQAEGLAGIFARHARLAAACRAGMQALGCSLYASQPAAGLTALRPPPGLAPGAIVKALQGSYALTTVGGQDQAKGEIFRLSHMGYVDSLDMLGLIGALEQVFATLQDDRRCIGRGLVAASAVL